MFQTLRFSLTCLLFVDASGITLMQDSSIRSLFVKEIFRNLQPVSVFAGHAPSLRTIVLVSADRCGNGSALLCAGRRGCGRSSVESCACIGYLGCLPIIFEALAACRPVIRSIQVNRPERLAHLAYPSKVLVSEESSVALYPSKVLAGAWFRRTASSESTSFGVLNPLKVLVQVDNSDAPRLEGVATLIVGGWVLWSVLSGICSRLIAACCVLRHLVS